MIGTVQVPWSPVLVKSYKKNFNSGPQADSVHAQLASVRGDGTPQIQRLVFQDFLSTDPRALLFSAATNNADLMSAVKNSQAHELFWEMPKTGELFTISGRMYIVAAPTMSRRFGAPPRRINIDSNTNPDDFWESERLRQWKRISPAYRATFTWAPSGESRVLTPKDERSVYLHNASVRLKGNNANAGYKYTRLEAMDDNTATNGGLLGTLSGYMGSGTPNQLSAKEQELRCAHNAAFDNFCLLVFKVTKVDHLTPVSGAPPSRVMYECMKDSSWIEVEVNP
ncbi:hypothetical protein BC832DRAFT_40148 [Gaertneriomyces semiglobifer]|nr:hypothetical protein BC832DRAFT_40148 [Gaertneriomyces semiglobifer]